jgi:hypothetical protein
MGIFRLLAWSIPLMLICAGACPVHAYVPSSPHVRHTIEREAEVRLKPFFLRAGHPYPPPEVAFIVLKEEGKLELWAGKDGRWSYIRAYDVYASGTAGPKRRRGDRQVPEGIYRITGLNPGSRYHLSLKIDYPNCYDRQKARSEGRSNLGGDIYIHGKAKSAGCIAVGDVAVEELFFLVTKTGLRHVRVVILPRDLRKGAAAPCPADPPWLPELYEALSREMSRFQPRERI